MDGLNHLLTTARSAGLTITVNGDKLVIRGPKHAGSIAMELIRRKAEVIVALASATKSSSPAAQDNGRPSPVGEEPSSAVIDLNGGCPARRRVLDATGNPNANSTEWQLAHGDALSVLKNIETGTVHLGLGDGPYFLHKLDNTWNPSDLDHVTERQLVKSLPSGMKFDRTQGKRLYQFYLDVSLEIHRILMPGAFFMLFSCARLLHRMTCAIEDAGFDIRDIFVWLYTQSRPKALSLKRFLNGAPGQNENEVWSHILSRWKTPQLKSCFEPIIVAQKTPAGTLLDNFMRHSVGLLDTGIRTASGMFPANCMITDHISEEIDRFFLVPKPTKEEKGVFNTHPTVKPLALIEHLIRLTTAKGATVLDPFVGSGTTGVAARRLGRRFIGIDANDIYLETAAKRISDSV